MTHYVKACNRCGEEIILSNENQDEKWAAYEYDEYGGETDAEYLDYHKCPPEDFEITCKFCDADIEMSKRAGKWLPYDYSGERHRCLGFGKGVNAK